MQHKHFNNLLNGLKTSSSSSASSLDYAHLRLVDAFYTESGGGGGSGKVRVTRDERTGVVQACVRKVRLGDLDVYSPKRAADWRISINVEIPGPFHFVLCDLGLTFAVCSTSARRDTITYTAKRSNELFA